MIRNEACTISFESTEEVACIFRRFGCRPNVQQREKLQRPGVILLRQIEALYIEPTGHLTSFFEKLAVTSHQYGYFILKKPAPGFAMQRMDQE